MPSTESLYDLTFTDNHGEEVSLADFTGKPVLVVNTASKCGFTPQYDDLQKLHEELGPQGLVVLGFPCDQFGNQEPGSEADIQQFCSLNYDVSFPMFAKIEVNGAGTHPLYQQLKAAKPGILGTEGIKWNFTKFLVGRDGRVLARYAPTDTPESLTADIAAALSAT